LDKPTAKYGNASTVRVDTSPAVYHILLRFDLSAIGSSTVTSAKLRLYTVDPSVIGGDFYRAVAGAWSESTVNWNNAPAIDGAVAPVSVGSVASGAWIEVEIQSLIVPGAETISLRATTPSTNAASYSSTEGTAGFEPQLVVTVQ
jgi:hypothetical protein